MHHVPRPAGAVAGLVLVALLCAPASAVAADVSSPRCAEAASLTEASRPRDAAKLVDQLRKLYTDPTLCRAEATSAAAAITSAEGMATDAQATAKTFPKAAAESARDALDADRDNVLAAQVLAKVAPEPETPGSWLDAAAARWTAFADGAGKDLATSGAVAAGSITLAVLLGRLLLLVPVRGRWASRLLARRSVRTLTGLLLVAAFVGLAMFSVAWLPGTMTETRSAASDRPLVGIGLALVATMLTWALLLTRRRVRIDITDKGVDGKSGAAAIVAHLRAMGSGPPRGLEIPIGSDVQALDGANITAGVKGPLNTLVTVLQSFLAVTPWRVLVDRESEDQVVVVISRHGRVVDTAVIRRQPWGVPGKDAPPAIDVNVMVAARVLMTLLDADGRYAGLSGARDWRSVGWQYDGAVLPHTPEERLQIFAKAAAADPGNLAALFSYRLERYRDSEEPHVLEHLIAWLDVAAEDGRAEPPLVARMRYTSYITWLNLQTLHASGADDADRGSTLLGALRESVDALPDVDSTDRGSFKRRLQSALGLFDPGVRGRLGPGEPIDLQPTTAYSLACFAAEDALHPDKRPDGADRPTHARDMRRRAVGYLKFAGPYAEAHAPHDPSLKTLRASQEYRQEYGPAPRSAMTEVEPFATVADQLEARGLTSPERIVDVGRRKLALLLRVAPSLAAEVVDAAAVANMVPGSLRDQRWELVDALRTAGVRDARTLDRRRRRRSSRQLLADVQRAYDARGAARPEALDLEGWLRPH